jgi:hypothetical protein
LKNSSDLNGIWKAIGGAFRVRFGGGAVGRLGQITIWGTALLVIISIVVVIRDPSFIPWAIGAPFVIVVLGLLVAFVYSLRHPQYAALGDAQMERIMRHDQTAKERRDGDFQNLDSVTLIDNPLLIEKNSIGKVEN